MNLMSNNGGWYSWSKTAAQNAVADQTVNWQAGMSPSSISPSGRAMMTSVAKGLADISGSLVTTGTSTNYEVSSNQQFDTLADFNGQMVCFVPHVTNGPGPVTMTVDGFPNLPLRSAPGQELPSGVLVQGAPYCVTFNQADNALYLHNFYGNQSVPIGGMIDYIGATSPFSNFVIPIGQAVSRTTFASLFELIGVTYGAGDGSTTFNLPNLSGRVTAMIDAAGTVLPGTSAVGALVGSATETLTLAQIPTGITSVQNQGFTVGVNSEAGNVITGTPAQDANGDGIGIGTINGIGSGTLTSVGTVPAGNVTTTSNNTGGGSHPNVQPTFGVNKLLRIA